MSTQTISKSSTWGGGNSPFNVSYGKLMMWVFLLSDAFTFSSLLIAYGAIRYSYDSTPIEQIDALELKFAENVQEKFAPDVAETASHAATALEHGAEHAAEHAEHFIPALRELGVFTEAQWPSPDLVFNHFPFAHGLHLPLIFVSLMTLILILSSVTMVLGVEAGQQGDQKAVSKWMLLTIIGGFMFLGCQAWEWTNFISAGARMWSNPYGPPAFAALFFGVTGFHGFHVFSGVVLNIIIYINNLKGTYAKRGHYEMVEKVGLYWHFVDLVWVFVFTFFYLI
ncbi:MAG: cytochrome c oxidase subunit 3 [Bacteroidia bacterium]